MQHYRRSPDLHIKKTKPSNVLSALSPNKNLLKLSESNLKSSLSELFHTFDVTKPRKNYNFKRIPVTNLNQSIEEAKEILDDDNPNNKKFITAEIMEKKSMSKVLKTRKRDFGFKKNFLSPPEHNTHDIKISPNAISVNFINKKLNSILYNNTYRNSQRSIKNLIAKGVEKGNIRSCNSIEKSKSNSPLPFINNKDLGVRNSYELTRQFKSVIEQTSLEAEIMKLKISKVKFRNGFFDAAH
jgi:hypothetical protein